jgi:uracil-DNA glycosylase family 4
VDRNRDERLREMGLTPVWRQRTAQPGPVETSAARPEAAQEAPAGAERSAPPLVADSGASVASIPRELEIAALTWDQLAPHIAACTACELCRTRKQTVPGVGVATAGWMFVGEAPGSEEDALGEPFVGQAGRLLDNMLKAIGLSRTRDVYIANVLKCRPPSNRNPQPDEVAKCSPYLERQLALIQPRLIVALGRFAALTLLNTDATIASLRGRVHAYRGVPLIVTYHPAYLLRNLPDKARAWEDLLFARRTFADLQSRESAPP